MKTRLQDRVNELVYVDAPNLWNTFKNRMIQACDEVCGKKKDRRNHRDTWWQYNTRKWHINKYAKIDRRKTRLDIRISKFKQRMRLLHL